MQRGRQTGRQVNIWAGRETEFKLLAKRDGLTSRGKVDDGEGPVEVMADNHLQGQVAEWWSKMESRQLYWRKKKR